MKKKITLSLVAIVSISLLPTLNAGSMEDYMKTQIDITPSQGYRSENVIGWSGGDMRLRFGTTQTIKMPINIQAPKLSVGCGGIDAELGGFAYLKDSLVQMFQNITSAAPAFAFQLAFKTLCSQCSATLSELKTIADQINNMSMDTCTASSNMVNTALGFIQSDGETDNTNQKSQGYLSGYLGNGSGGNVISDYLTKAQGWLSGKGVSEPGKALTKMQGSWLEKSIDETSKANLNTLLDGKALPMMRALIGDVYGYMGDNGVVYKQIDPIWSTNEIKRFVGVENDGLTQLRVIAISNPSQDTNKYDPPVINTTTSINFTGLKTIFKEPISRILTTLGQPGATLNAVDVSFIAAMPVPIYKILNSEILAKGYGNADIDELSEFIASQQALAILELTVGAAQRYLASFKLENANWSSTGAGDQDAGAPVEAGMLQQAFFSTLNQNTQNIRNIVAQQYAKSAQDFIAKREQKIQVRKIEQEIKAEIAKSSLYLKSGLTAF